MKKRAFTLSEILIALTVIGVISAVTVPVLMQNTNKQEYVTALKKAYSTLSQVTNQITAEEGSPKSTTSTSRDGWAYSGENIYKTYKKYLYNIRECGTSGGCFIYDIKGLNGLPAWGASRSGFNYYSMILSDGAQILFEYSSSLCGGNPVIEGSENICAKILVDVNGNKAPNKMGFDAFVFVIKEDGLHPMGCDYPNAENACKKTGKGIGCACKVLREGAINY